MARRIVFVGGLAPSMFEKYKELIIYYRKISLHELADLVKDAEVINFVRHESTVKLLSSILNRDLTPNTGLYKWGGDDTLVVIGLKRPIRGQEMDVKPEDLDLVYVRIYPSC